jgi:hypothetical protein
MWFPFLFKTQLEVLKQKINHLDKRQWAPWGTNSAIASAKHNFVFFEGQTKTLKNKILSFIPLTYPFKLRMICAAGFVDANKLLDKIEKVKVIQEPVISGSYAKIGFINTVKIKKSDDTKIVQTSYYKNPIMSKVKTNKPLFTLPANKVPSLRAN